jgi:rhamnosyltransferase
MAESHASIMNAAHGLEVLAIVVSYNGGVKTIETVNSLLAQVRHVHIVDNGSLPDSADRLRQLPALPSLSMTFLQQNLGIAAALNVGVEVARESGFQWILTMDQDSMIGPGMIAAYAAVLSEKPDAMFLIPNVCVKGVDQAATEGPVEFAITSGSLVRTTLFAEVGAFAEPLFIDGVDIDFCLRVRRLGHTILRVRGARIYHELGEPIDGGGWLARVYARHSPLRRYYMYRNHLYLIRTFWRDFPGFILKATLYQVLLLVLVAFYDREPRRSLEFIVKGVRDFFGDRMGAYREVA